MTLHSVGGARRPRRHQYVFWGTEGFSPAPDCFEVIANSILWDPFGMQWGCDGHWPLLLACGTKRYRSEGMQQRPADQCRSQSRKKQHRSNDWQEEDVEHAALAAYAPQQAPDTGGASGSADVPTYMLPNVQAARTWSQASWVGHTH